MSTHHPIKNIWVSENRITYLIDKRKFYVVYYLGDREIYKRCDDIYEAVGQIYEWTKDAPTFTSNVPYSMGACEPLGEIR